MFNISYLDENNRDGIFPVDRIPNECPICHKSIRPNHVGAFFNSEKRSSLLGLQIIFRCPDEECRNMFISFYREGGVRGNFYLVSSEPYKFIPKEFGEFIKSTSPDFIEIYNQAYVAEQLNLKLICGCGYRKSLEFLIKDYLITKEPEQGENIKKEFLGNCIQNRLSDPKLKEVAKRATWLGNDETHYERKWQEKDITDLKRMIDLTLHWIEVEKLTEESLQSMPETTQGLSRNP